MKIPNNKLDLTNITNQINQKFDASNIGSYQEGQHSTTGYITLVVNGVTYKLLAST